MVWLSKREVAYYLILKKKFGGREFNIGEAINLLSLFGSRRIARKIIKRLRLKGFLESVEITTYRIASIDEVLVKLLSSYILQRLYRNLKSRGYSIVLSRVGQYSTLEVRNCNGDILAQLEVIRGLGIDVLCVER